LLSSPYFRTPITERSRTGTTLSLEEIVSTPRAQSQITVQEYARREARRYRLVENQIKTAEVLLQQMFEDEIGTEDTGPQTLIEIEELEPAEEDWSKMTFDTIG
jgi:hypothetical protein